MIHDLVRHLVTWIYQHPHYAGLALFLLSAGESMTVIGSFIPGTIVMTAVGIFIGANLLPYWPMVAWAACGTLFGDALNFTLGYYLKDNINDLWPFRTHQHWLTKGKNFFEKHGGKSIFFARFIGPLRAFAPIIAGAMHMPASKFYLIDSLSALTWAMIYLLPGILLGEASLELAPDITEHLFRFVFVTLLIIILSIWIGRLLILHINEVVKNALSCLWTKMKEIPSFSYICYLFRHHKADHPRGQLGTLLVFLLLLIAFTWLSCCIYTHYPPLITYNNAAHYFAQSLRMQWLDNFMLIITLLGQKEILAVSFVVVLSWLCYCRCWRSALFWLGSFFIGVATTYALKNGLHIHRPSQSFETIDGFSYPSGHVVLATLFYGGLAYLAASHCLLRFRWAGYSIASVIIAAVACSRILLGVHWLTDILGSVLLGWLCLVFMALFYQRYSSQNIHPAKIIPGLIILQLLLTWGYVHYHDTQLTATYFPQATTRAITATTWWQQGYPPTRMMATNRFGTAQELLRIQWAANKNSITQQLQAQGWQSIFTPHNWVLDIQHPENKTTQIHLQFKSYFFNARKPQLIFYKPLNIDHAFMVLQLWKTDITIQPPGVELFAGNLSLAMDVKHAKVNFGESGLTTEFLQSLGSTVMTRVISTSTSQSLPTILNDAAVILIQ